MSVSARDLIVVFGAGVRANGTASPTLARRTAHALKAANADPTAGLFLSGAVGAHPPSEASVMAGLLSGHVDPTRIVLDEASRDTLQTVRAATRHAHANGYTRCLACTDRYHQPRARMLFALFGMPAAGVAFEDADRRAGGRWKMRLREAAAIPYDLVAGWWQSRRTRRGRA